MTSQYYKGIFYWSIEGILVIWALIICIRIWLFKTIMKHFDFPLGPGVNVITISSRPLMNCHQPPITKWLKSTTSETNRNNQTWYLSSTWMSPTISGNNPQCLTKPAQFQRQRLHFDDSTALLIKSICSLLSQYLKGKSNLQNLASEVF